MNNDTSDNNRGHIDRRILTHSQNAVNVIGSLRQWFMRCCNACPAFLMNSIDDAFKSAFYSTVIKERRPLLIYVHHNNSTSIDKFCLEIFCQELIIEFLRENYIVWPWDITDESNRQILIRIWEEIFPGESFIDFHMERCPMLIGIMRRSPGENDLFPALSYEFKVLLAGDTLVDTFRTLNLATLLDQLANFKEEFDRNEQYLSFDFVQKTGLCWELILEIAKYLSLNDAVTIFSTAILPLLSKFNVKLPIVEPSVEFMTTLIQKIKSERIVSLRLKAVNLRSTMELAPSATFANVASLSLDNVQRINPINEFKTRFPKLKCFFLRYDQIDFQNLCKIFNQIEMSTKRFEIHCDSVLCPHRYTNALLSRKFNTTVESFVLIINRLSSSLVNNCVQLHNKCLLMTIIDFIKIMSNIRHVRVVINRGNVEKFFDASEWTSLVKICKHLEKITLKVINNTSQDTQLGQKIQDIENDLHKVRQSIKFQVKTR